MHNELIGGVIAAEIFNNAGTHREGTLPIGASDRMPSYDPPQQSADQIMAVIRGVGRAARGTS